tara:strand:+ start:4545 stop:5225 length:681 start_codon:yes stop_codon:yes gene_type:complete
MKIGVMQPYFFPYLGYFQLIDAVDVYVNLDHVSFMKTSYMTRNTLKNNTSINIPVLNGSQNKTCVEVNTLADEKWFKKFERTLELLYKKENNYQIILDEIILPWKNSILSINRPVSISEFNFSAIYYICKYLNIEKRFYSSGGITTRKKNEGLQDITKYFKGDTYINAIGGQKLYSKEDFESQEIDLIFIKMGEVKFDNPYSSILDLLFRYDKEFIKNELKNYTLI